MSKIRTRFAPSPTGPLHIGGVRTALYCYLFSKQNGGDFVLRIEDTDRNRYVEGAESYILDSLKWAGIMPGEGFGIGGEYGPYKQSERKHLYRQYADQLIESGHAYYAFDTSEELVEMRERLEKAGDSDRQYSAANRLGMRNSLSLSSDEVQENLKQGVPYVIRLKVPENEDVEFNDLVRGSIVVNSANLDDKVLFKSDGMPTYHLANIVDDHLMKITHVIRGEEWLPSAPSHVLLYRYLGWKEEMPEFAHLPLILKPDGNGKLSKRDGDRLGFPVFPLTWTDPKTGNVSSGYKEQGYFNSAFVNMLAFLGWNPGDNKELFTLEELLKEFSIEKVNKAGAKFDPDKTKWFQQQYLRSTPNEVLAEMFMPILEESGIERSKEYVSEVCNLMKERSTFLKDMLDAGMYLFTAPESYDEKTLRKKWKEQTPEIMEALKSVLNNVEDFNAETIEVAFKSFLEERELGFGAVLPGFRLLVTGEGNGPSMFEICALLGREEVENRIETGLNKIQSA